MSFEIVRTTLGVMSIRNTVVGQTMHAPVGPWIEANSLYIEQGRLFEKLQPTIKRDDPFVLFDVGLGAAANALAAMHCAHKVKGRRIRIVSFEKDLELLHFALENSHHFDHFKGYESAVAKLLKDNSWEDEFIHWELREGDFLNEIEKETEKAHLVFFDPYSFQVNSEMWTLDSFKKLRAKCDDSESVLLTYSKATPIRTALLCAGFYVGYGKATGVKDETTQAATSRQLLDRPLDARWMDRWKKSHAPFPPETQIAEQSEIQRVILSHPQFY